MLLFVGLTLFFVSKPFNLSSGYQIVKTDAQKIKQVLDIAREKAITNEKQSNWGIYFSNTSSSYYLFAGDNFLSSTEYTIYYLNPNNVFFNPTSTKEIIFQRYSGYATDTELEIGLKNGNVKAKIKINYFGKIDFEIY